MRRSVVSLGILALAGLIAGCGGNPREDLIVKVVAFMNSGSKQMREIRDQVDAAVAKAEKEKTTQLDLSKASSAADKLKEIGSEAEKIKARIEADRGQITEAARTENKETNGNEINRAFQSLLQQQEDLHKALQKAEAINRNETQKFEAKLREAMAPFETMSRQSS